MRRSRLLLGAATALSALVLSGCALGGSSTDAKTVTVYTSRPAEISSTVIEGFEKKYPQYHVRVVNLGAQDVAERVKAEASKPQADVWWGGTTQQFSIGVDNHLLAPFPQTIVDRVPATYRGKDNLWLGEQRLAEVIAYNPEMLSADKAPRDWDDLIAPALNKKILIRDVAASGTMHSIYDALIYRDFKSTGSPDQGYAFLRKLDANTKDYTASPQDLYLRIQRQEAPVTVWDLQDILTQQAAGVPLTPVTPMSGSPIVLDGIGKVKGDPNPAGADAFATYLLSQPVQTSLADDHFQLSTVPLAQQPGWLSKLDLKEMDVDWGVVSAKDADWIGYWVDHIKNKG